MIPMVGLRYADTRDTVKDSRYILCWGNNPAVTMQAYFKNYNQARRNGARMVVIDPRFNETAAKADEWISIIPGTDTALALGMIKIIIEENLTDKPFYVRIRVLFTLLTHNKNYYVNLMMIKIVI